MKACKIEKKIHLKRLLHKTGSGRSDPRSDFFPISDPRSDPAKKAGSARTRPYFRLMLKHGLREVALASASVGPESFPQKTGKYFKAECFGVKLMVFLLYLIRM